MLSLKINTVIEVTTQEGSIAEIRQSQKLRLHVITQENNDFSPRYYGKQLPGQQATSKKHMTSMSGTSEPAIKSCDNGQRIPCFDSCQVTISWMSNIKDSSRDGNLLPHSGCLLSPHPPPARL